MAYLLEPHQLARDADAPLDVVRFLFEAAEYDSAVVRLIRGAAIDQETVRLRRAIIWVSRLHTTASLPQIGRALNRDHSSVQRSLMQADSMYVNDSTFRDLCRRIVRRKG